MFRYWVVKGEKIPFPSEWEKQKVVNWVNTDIRICPFCGKVDVPRDHFKKYMEGKNDNKR